MEPNVNFEAQQPESVVENADCELRSSEVTQEPESEIISLKLLEFKTSLLEAVEELHIHRDAEIRHEGQICKLALEKQELAWQKESLQSQMDRMANEYSESLAAVKKQFQAQLRGIEGEKGKHQLTAELKDKEITSLKEELKLLQLLKYSLEKKLNELEQKLQLQTQVKDRHLNQLGEVEKRFGTVMRQYTMVKQAHEKLEQNVEEAVWLNKKLTFINKTQESTIAALKQDVERLNSEMVKYKVVSVCRSGEESSNFLLKEQLQELKQRLTVETELNKKLRNENAVERAEKQKLMSSLQHTQGLLLTQTQALCRNEQQLLTHTEKYQILKREHEMIQEMGKEKEDKLMLMIEEYKNSELTLEKEIHILQAKMEADQKELKAVKEAYDHLHEKQQSSCAVHHAKNMLDLENGLEDSFDFQKKSPSNVNCDAHLYSAGNLCKDVSIDTKNGQRSPENDCEQMRRRKEVKDIPDESTAECQEAAKDGCNHEENGEVKVCSQMDRTALVPPPPEGTDALAPDQSEESENISGGDVLVTHLHEDPVVKQEASVIKSVCDNSCPLSVAQNYTDGCLARLSEPETRSVYGVASDPLMSKSRDRPEEQSLGVSEMRERQTSDKHSSKTSQDSGLKDVVSQTTALDTNNLQVVLPNVREHITEESGTYKTLQNKDVLKYQTNQKQLETPDSSSTQQIIPASQGEKTLHKTDKTFRNSDSHLSPQEGLSPSFENLRHQETLEDVSKNTEETEVTSNTFSQGIVDITLDLSENEVGNKIEDNCTAATSAQMMKEQENADASPGPLMSDLLEDALSVSGLPKRGQLNDTGKQNIDNEPSYLDDGERNGLPVDPNMFQKKTLDTGLKSSQSAAEVLSVKSTKISSVPSRSLQQKSAVSSGFQELQTSLNSPIFSRHKFRNRGASVITQTFGKFNVSSVHPDQKSDHHREWHAIKQTFSENSVEKENRVPISFGSAQLGSPATQSVGNGLRHDGTPTPPPRLHGLGKVSQPVSEESTPTPLEREDLQQSDIRAQITKIEQLLYSEGFTPQKRRRMENCEVLKP